MEISKITDYCVSQILAETTEPLLVGVIGDSGSGKSYFSQHIQTELTRRGKRFVYLNHDEFLIPRKEREPLKRKTYQSGEHQGKSHWEVLENWSRLDVFERVLTELKVNKPTSFYPYQRETGEVSKT